MVAPLLGEDKVGAEGKEDGGIGVGVGSGSSPNPNSEQATPEASNIHKSNTMVILGNFILCLQLVQEIFRRIFCSICIVIDYSVVVDLSTLVASRSAEYQVIKPRNVAVIYLFCRLWRSPEDL